VGFNPPVELNNSATEGIAEDDFWLVMLQIYNAFRIFKKYGIYEDRVMRRLTKIINGTPHIKDCAGCGNQLVVGADGRIGPCQAFLGTGEFFKAVNLANYIFDKDNVIKEWNNLSSLTKNDCSKCPFVLICGNGCPYYAKSKTGKLTDIDRRYCKMLPIMINESMKDNFYNKPKAIFLDYDDTIMIRPALQEVFNKIGEKFNLKYKTLPQGFFNPKDYFKENGVKEKDLDAILEEYKKLRENGATLNNILIKQLNKIKLPKYILTNGNSNMVKKELEKFPNIGPFAGIFGNEIYRKPSKDFYINAFNSTGLQPEDIIYIGDFKNDIYPMYSLGARVVLFNPSKANMLFNNDWLINLCK
jgi:HAD superfamily hydrolase (TIGR01549 family)